MIHCLCLPRYTRVLREAGEAAATDGRRKTRTITHRTYARVGVRLETDEDKKLCFSISHSYSLVLSRALAQKN